VRMVAVFRLLYLKCHQSHESRHLTPKVARIGKVEKTLVKVKSIS